MLTKRSKCDCCGKVFAWYFRAAQPTLDQSWLGRLRNITFECWSFRPGRRLFSQYGHHNHKVTKTATQIPSSQALVLPIHHFD